jgi:hypothetical protein
MYNLTLAQNQNASIFTELVKLTLIRPYSLNLVHINVYGNRKEGIWRIKHFINN